MASGAVLAIFEAGEGIDPSVGFAPLNQRNNHVAAFFSEGVDESIDFPGFLLPNYSGGGLTATLIWLADVSVAGDVVWNIQFERHQAGVTDLDVDNFAATQSVIATAPTTLGTESHDIITFTNGAQMDGLLPEEKFRLRVTRPSLSDANDTMVGDALLSMVVVEET